MNIRIDRETVYDMWAAGYSDVEIAKHFNAVPVSISKIRCGMGCYSNRKPPMKKEKLITLKDQIIAICKENKNLTSSEIANILNRPRKPISAYITKLQKEGARIEYKKRPNQIMTVEIVQPLIEQGLCNSDIAMKLKVKKGSLENFIWENDLGRGGSRNGWEEKKRNNATSYGMIKGVKADEVWAQLSADAFRRNVTG